MGFVNVIQSNIFVYTICSICALLMAVLITYTAAKLFFIGSKKDKLEYLKNYKKGQFIFIYLIAIPLYFTGLARLSDCSGGDGGMRLFQCFLEAIDCALSLVKFDFGMGEIVAYMQADAFYATVVTICFLLTIFNVILFTASLIWQRAMNFFRGIRARFSKEVYLAVGGNEENLCLLRSVRDRGKQCILLCVPDADLKDKLYLERIPYVKFSCERQFVGELGGNLGNLFGRKLKRGGLVRKNVVLVLNTKDSKTDYLLTQEAYAFLCAVSDRPFRYSIASRFTENANSQKKGNGSQTAPQENLGKDSGEKSQEKLKKESGKTLNEASQTEPQGDFQGEPKAVPKAALPAFEEAVSLKQVPVTAAGAFLSVYVYGELSDKDVYSDLIKDSDGHITFLNRYELVALDFIKQYPFTRFMTKDQLDYEHGLVRDGWDFNVCFIGFGPTDKQIFLRMVSDAQLYTMEGGEIVHKKINYSFFDRQPVYMDKTFNHTYNRYTQAFLKDEYEPENFLPLPDIPANDGLFVNGRAVSWNENSHFHCVDINDYRFFEELRTVLFGGKKSYNYIIISFGEDLEDIDFAKQIKRQLDLSGLANNTYLFAKVRDKLLAEELARQEDAVIPFGSSSDTVFDIIHISEDPIRQMAQYKSFAYPRGSGDMNWEQRYRNAIQKWLGDNSEVRESNYFCCLGLRLKLNLLGFDYVPAETDAADAGQEYLHAYFETDDEARIDQMRHMFEGAYDESVYTDGSLRTRLAMLEHQRWNAYEITCGYLPSPLAELYAGKAKDPDRLRQGCLTTFAGLAEYRKALNGEMDSIAKNEKRKHDYKVLDIADLILYDVGFKIIRRP